LTWWQLSVLLAGRLVANTAFRVVYPLLAALAAGFGVPLATASLLVTVQVAATLLSPLGGTLSDARGERFTMGAGLALLCAGALVCALAGSFAPFLLGYALIGLGTSLFNPAVQAYASARTPYSRRGRVLGLLELSWALAALVGVTGLAVLIGATGGLASAYWALLLLGLMALVGTLVGLPEAPRTATGGERRGLALPRVLAQPGALAALLVTFCTIGAAELLFVVYAGWLRADFGASDVQLSTVFGALGFVELAGALGTTLLADRIGKRRAVALGLAGAAAAQLLLPLSAGNWLTFLPLFFAFDLCFEFAIVSTFPLLSGVVPSARGTMLALGVAAAGLARVLCSLAGVALWQQVGFVANGALAGALSLAGVALCLTLVRAWKQSRRQSGCCWLTTTRWYGWACAPF
jgi:predicted MFS family arabinose efflux permease